MWTEKFVNIGAPIAAEMMDTSLLSHLNFLPSELSKDTTDVLEYYETIEKILDETYRALGAGENVEVSTSIASNNMKIDVKSFGSLSSAEICPGLV